METPPGFFTTAYHLRFFPAVLRARLRPRPPRGGFGNHALLELPIILAVSTVLLALGVPRVVDQPASISGIVLVLLGAAGIIAMLAVSIRAGLSTPVTYDEFEPFVFLFMLLLGATAALFFARMIWKLPAGLTWALVIAGLVPGYLAGIAAGLFSQILGPLKATLGILAVCGAIGLLVVDLVVLLAFNHQ